MQLDDFLIDKYEVTNLEFKKFIDAGGYRERQVLEISIHERWPRAHFRTGRSVVCG